MASYFDDFLDIGDNQPMDIGDIPDAFKDLAVLGNLPPEIAGNAITSALKGQNTSTTPLTTSLSRLDPSDPSTFDTYEGVPGGIMDFVQNVPGFTGEPTFDLDPVRERTRELELLALLDPYQFNPNYGISPINPPMYDPIAPPPPVAFDPLSAPQYAGGYVKPLTPEEQLAQQIGLSTVGTGGGSFGQIPIALGNFYNFLKSQTDQQAVTTNTGQYRSVDKDLVFKPDAAGDYRNAAGILGDYVTPEELAKEPTEKAREEALRATMAEKFAQAQPQAFGATDPNVNISFGGTQGMGGYNLKGLLDQRLQPIISSQVPPIFDMGIGGPTGLQGRDRTIGTTAGYTYATPGEVIDEGAKPVKPVKPKPVDVDSDDAEATVQNGGIADPELLTVKSKVNDKNKIGTEGRTEAFDLDGNLIPEGERRMGESLYIYRNGEWIPRGEFGNITETDEQFFARLDDQTEDVPSAPPSAPGAPQTWFPPVPTVNYGSSISPSRTATDQFGQPVVQATGQPMQQVMRAPATYGEVLGGTPMQPMTTTGGFYDDLYQQSLSPVDAFKQYQLSQFPGASLGSRLAAQDALGSGFTPAFGRFLLGSASGRIAPQEGVDASSGFSGYLRDRQRADLSQVRQEFANLGGALRGYAPGGTLDQRFPSYYETFGDPSDPTGLKNAVLQASQAALGTRQRTGALGNIYDVMQQQYGTGGSSRFADFISGAFNQQPMMQSFAPNMPSRSASYSLAPPTFPGLPAYDPYNPINRLGATTAASARVQPLVTPNYQPMSGFGTPLTNQQYGPAGIAQG